MGLFDKLLGRGKPATASAPEPEPEAESSSPPSDAWDAAAHQLTADELAALLAADEDSLKLIDVREMWEFNSGSVPGAINIPLSELGIMVRDLEPEKHYITICAMGMRSLDAAYLLSSHGFEQVHSLAGGMSAWNARKSD